MEMNAERPFALLLVNDEPAVVSPLARKFRKCPYDLCIVGHGRAALQVLKERPIDAAVIDLTMPGMGALELLAEMRNSHPHVRVVMLAGCGQDQEAVDAFELGAVDLLQKPFLDESLMARIEQLHSIWRLEKETRRLKEQVQFGFGFDSLIGTSEPVMQLKKMILQVAPSDASILVQGETGTGKALVARAIHHHSPRRAQPFVPVDCAGLHESVMDNLFGRVEGVFAGAQADTPGLIRKADKGTLFLDEVGDLPPNMQAKLLRIIQEREVRPVGASRSHPVDVRYLAATRRDLEQEIARGRFRQDLYYRLNVVNLPVPPLRERVEDVPLLIRHFMGQASASGGAARTVSRQALACLMAYDWPGNVGELESVIRRAVALGTTACIRPSDLPEHLQNGKETACPAGSQAAAVHGDSLDAYQMAAIRNALAKCAGNRKKAARLLEIGEATLYRKLKKYTRRPAV